jgi:hypothetical protein
MNDAYTGQEENPDAGEPIWIHTPTTCQVAAPDETPRPSTDDPEPSAPTPEGSDRSLRQRIADRWNGLGVTGKAGVVVGVAVVLGGGLLAFSNLRKHEADHEDITGLTDGNADLLSLTAAEQDSTDNRAAPQYGMESWMVDPYLRDTCLNPRLHPDGCTHEHRLVASSTRNRRKELLTVDS